ncbi:MAG: NfeD family protein [Oscillospiraceae bacterium]|nr:NfeD family protein [Oscillospiraceae bacterium]
MENIFSATWIIWAVLLVGALILEGVSMQLFSVWFALGALAALIAALLEAETWLQIALFVVVTAASLAATRPLVRKLRKDVQPTNADRAIGKSALVVEEIDNRKATGQIKLEGMVWTARNLAGNDRIAEGQMVEIKEIQGVKVMVTPAANTVVAEA